MQTTISNQPKRPVKGVVAKKSSQRKPFLMNFVEKKRVYSLSQQATTSCQYANGMTPDD
jgi:hypothetical protein